MSVKKLNSLDPFDYEIYVRRRGDNNYASYCPQLNLMINGTEHEQVVQMMREAIHQHIENLKKQSTKQNK